MSRSRGIRSTVLGVIVTLVLSIAVGPTAVASAQAGPSSARSAGSDSSIAAASASAPKAKPVPKFKHRPQAKTSQPATPPKQLSTAERDAMAKKDRALAPLAASLKPGQLDELRATDPLAVAPPDAPVVGAKPSAGRLDARRTTVTKQTTQATSAQAATTTTYYPPTPVNIKTPKYAQPGQTTWEVTFAQAADSRCPNCINDESFQIDFYNAADNSLVWSFVYGGVYYDPQCDCSYADPTVPSFAEIAPWNPPYSGGDMNTSWVTITDGPLAGMAGSRFYAKITMVDLIVNADYSKTVTAWGTPGTSPIAAAVRTPGIAPNQSGGPGCGCDSADRADPVDTATGMVHESVVDVATTSPGMPFSLTRGYRSDAANTAGLLGKGWALPVESALSVGSSSVTLTDLGGSQTVFTKNADGSFTAPAPAVYALAASGSGYTLTELDDQSRRQFDGSGRLTGWVDHNGVGYSVARDGTGRVASVTDAANRVYTFHVDATSGRLGSVSLPDGSSVQYAYTNGQLSQVTGTDQAVTKYTYDAAGRLATMVQTVNGSDVTVSQNTYDAATGRITQQIDATGGKTTFSWTPDADGVAGSGRADTTDPDGGVWSDYYAAGVLMYSISPTSQSDSHGVDTSLNVTSAYDSATGTTSHTFDDSGNLLASTDAKGETDSYTYNAAHQVTSHTDGLGRKTLYHYNAANQMDTVTDPLGKVTAYTYTATGQVWTVTKPNGGQTVNSYDAQDNLQSVTTPAGTTSYTYDALGRKLTETDPRGNVAGADKAAYTTTYKYDGAGRVVSVTDPLNGVTSYQYDAAGNLHMQTDAENNSTVYVYDGAGRQKTMTDPLNNVTTYTYDIAGNRTSTVDPLGNTTTYTYDKAGRRLSSTDATGAVSTSAYDYAGRLVAQSDVLGNVSKTSYDGMGRVATTTDPTGAVTTNVRDAAGQLVEVDSPAGATRYAYDAAGHKLTQTSPMGEVTSWTYDADGNVTSMTDPRGNVAGANKASFTTRFSYDKADRKVSQTDALGRKTLYTYDSAGNVTVATDPLGHTTTTVYDALNRATSVLDTTGATVQSTVYDHLGHVKSSTDALGNKTTYTFDADGRELTVVSPRGNQPGADPTKFTTTYGYDADGNRVSVQGPTGAITTTKYDADNHLSQVVDPLGNNTLYAYDASGNLLAAVDQNGAQTTYGYDGANRRTSTTDDLGNITADGYDASGRHVTHTTPLGTSTWSYDADNRMTGMVDPRGNVAGAKPSDFTTAYGYDPAGHQTSVTDPLQHTTGSSFDGAGQLIARTNGNNEKVAFGYDRDGRLLTVTGADLAVTRYAYDAVGNLTSRTDANSHTTHYGYDADKHVISVTDPVGAGAGFGYDADGNQNSRTDARGVTSTVTFDARNLITAISYSDSTPPISYGYDAAGHRTGITDASGSRTLKYDPLGRLQSVSQPGAANPFAYQYNSIGQLTSRTYPDGDSTAYTWVNGVQTAQTSAGATTNYSYDAAGRLLTTQQPAANGYTETRAYDNAGNLASVGTAKAGSTLSSWAITRDKADRPNQIVATRSGQSTTTTTYGYDAAGRVQSQTCTAAAASLDCPGGSQNVGWSYDKVGNRLSQTIGGNSTTYHYNNLDELTSATTGSATTSYGYDADGNMISAGTDAFTYDPGNRLTGYTHAGTSATFTINDEGDRAGVTVGGVTQNLAWDINNALPQLAYQTGPAGSLGDYHYNPLGVPLNVKTSTGTLFTAHDGLGSVTDLTDQNGALQAQYAYNAYGVATASSGSSQAALAANPFGYTGQLNDLTVLGDQDLRARDYDPSTGRFSSRDAIDLRVKDPYVAAYVYAGDGPTYGADPSGMDPQTEAELNIAVADIAGIFAKIHHQQVLDSGQGIMGLAPDDRAGIAFNLGGDIYDVVPGRAPHVIPGFFDGGAVTKWAINNAHDDTTDLATFVVAGAENCTNFASFALLAGGMAMKKDKNAPSWWTGAGDNQYNAIVLGLFGREKHTLSWTVAPDLYNFLTATGSREVRVDQAAPGDIMFWENFSNRAIHHTAVLTATAVADLLYTQHSQPALNKSLALNEFNYEKEPDVGQQIIHVVEVHPWSCTKDGKC